jgi:hypothetical protein
MANALRRVRTACIVAALAALTIPADGTPVPPRRRGPNAQAEAAKRWLDANKDRFALRLDGIGSDELYFATRKKKGEGARQVFVITQAEARLLVQTLVDACMWDHPDPSQLGPRAPGRYLTVLPWTERFQGWGGWKWRLGGIEDDISSLFIIRALLKISRGEQKAALERWLAHGVKEG